MADRAKASTASVEVTRADAEIIVEALAALQNLRRLSFKDADQDPRELYADVAATLDRVRQQLDQAFD